MNPEDFKNSTAGKCFKTLKDYYAFIPYPLPPLITYDSKFIQLLSQADRLLGELSGTGRILKNPYLLISPYIRREAVSSSRIEGTQSSLSDLFFFEASEMKIFRLPDIKEVFNYVQAMMKGIELLDKVPISTRLICELHTVLMTGVRGEHGTPGELRRSQNWIGTPGGTLNEATFVPPPVDEMQSSLSDWEKYLNSEQNEPVLIQAALMHYQFEAIHPFIDGNGRIGRLLITLFLCQQKSLSQPLLYLSEFFDTHRNDYYDRLLAVSRDGDWHSWIEFFLRGVITMAQDALENAQKILDLHETFSQRINQRRKSSDIVHRLIDEIFVSPVISNALLSKKWDLPFNSVKGGILKLEKMGILTEVSGKRRNKLYASKELLNILIK